MNWWLFIRLGWIIPLCILSLYTVFALLLMIFIDWFIDMELLQILKADTEEKKKEHRNNLFKLYEIKINIEMIKTQVKKLFKK